MANYLLGFHGGGMPETEEEKTRIMAAWTRWYDDLGSAMVDPGNPVGPAMTINPDGTVAPGGGPNPVSGYSVIRADSMDQAVKLSGGCPILQGGGSIEVCETFEVM